MGKMFLMCGLSGAGKTTFAKKFAEENGYDYLAIDDVYKCWNYRYDDLEDSFQAWMKFFQAIHCAECHKHDVVIDTNAPTFVKRAQFIDWFPTFDEHNLIYIEADRDLRRRNNLARDRVVPDDEMRRMEGEFEPPLYTDGEYAWWTDENWWSDEYYWDHTRFFLNENNILREIPICDN